MNNYVPKNVMHSLNTDTGRGVTREGLVKEMNKYSRTCSLNEFLITTCSYYSFNFIIVLLHVKYFSNSSISNRKLIQFLCTCDTIQKLCKIEEFEAIWMKK